MADYIYLLQTRLTPAQLSALNNVREVAKARSQTVFLVGGAVRDLTAGFSIRDLDFAIQGNALKLKKDFQKAGFVLTGEHEPTQTLFFSAPGGRPPGSWLDPFRRLPQAGQARIQARQHPR